MFMKYLVLPLWLFSHFVQVFAVTVLQPNEVLEQKAPEKRKLTAASRHSGIQTRSDSFTLSNEVELVYAEGGDNGFDARTMAATVRLRSNRSILVLEEIEHLLYNIECTFGSIQISTSDEMDQHMCSQLHGLGNGGHIITSHISCNNVAGRQAYKVLSTSQSTRSTITLDILPVAWNDKESFTSISIKMNHEPSATYNVRNKPLTSDPPDLSKRQPDLSKRQGMAYSANNFSFSDGGPTVSSFGALPSSPPDYQSGKSYSFDLAKLGPFINDAYTFTMPGSLQQQAPVAVGCANCTFWGTIGLDFVGFDIDTDDYSVSGGTASITARGVGAHVYLKSQLTNTWYFTFPIPDLGLSYAFEIADVGEIQFGVGLFVAGGYDMTGSVSMYYGFDMQMPATSTMTLDLSDYPSADQTGFGSTNFQALPFDSEAEIQALTLWLALRTAVSVKVVVGETVYGDAGAYIDVPRINAEVTPVSNVDVHCNPITSQTQDADQDQNILTDPIKVDVYGSWDYGAYANLKWIDLPWDNFEQSQRVAYPPMCLNFDSQSQSYSTAEQAVYGTGMVISAPSLPIMALIVAAGVLALL